MPGIVYTNNGILQESVKIMKEMPLKFRSPKKGECMSEIMVASEGYIRTVPEITKVFSKR